MIDLHTGDAISILDGFQDNSFDAAITDPPYNLTDISKNGKSGQQHGNGFMNRSWDATGITFSSNFWAKVQRVLKPGSFLLAFCGTRNYHRMATAIEAAHFVFKDVLIWAYISGFPKGVNVGKKIAGITGSNQWAGWHTALKPAVELICLAHKPLSEESYTQNMIAHGTGALNIDACRIPLAPDEPEITINTWDDGAHPFGDGAGNPFSSRIETRGRWPSNVLFDEGVGNLYSEYNRFFFCAKASRAEKDAGLEEFPERLMGISRGAQTAIKCGRDEYIQNGTFRLNKIKRVKNHHPTVKPVSLMRYLCRLVTQPGGTVLDPFMGSGTTGVACKLEGFGFTGIDVEKDYVDIARQRISSAERDSNSQMSLW